MYCYFNFNLHLSFGYYDSLLLRVCSTMYSRLVSHLGRDKNLRNVLIKRLIVYILKLLQHRFSLAKSVVGSRK